MIPNTIKYSFDRSGHYIICGENIVEIDENSRLFSQILKEQLAQNVCQKISAHRKYILVLNRLNCVTVLLLLLDVSRKSTLNA